MKIFGFILIGISLAGLCLADTYPSNASFGNATFSGPVEIQGDLTVTGSPSRITFINQTGIIEAPNWIELSALSINLTPSDTIPTIPGAITYDSNGCAWVTSTDGTPIKFIPPTAPTGVWTKVGDSIYPTVPGTDLDLTGDMSVQSDSVFIGSVLGDVAAFNTLSVHDGTFNSLTVTGGSTLNILCESFFEQTVHISNSVLLGDAEVKYENETHDPIYLSGQTGLNDLSSSGLYSLVGTAIFQVKIEGTGTPDDFEWRKGTSGTWTGPIVMTGSAQLLQDDISITWGATTGHDNNDGWEIIVGHEVHISHAMHVDSSVFVEDDLVLVGSLRSLSPIKIEDGIRFINKETGNSEFHQYISGTDTAITPLPSAFDGALVFKTNVGSNLSDMDAIFWDGINLRPSLTINQGGPGRASVFERGVMIGNQLGAKTLDTNYTVGTGDYPRLAFNTSTTGADLGVEHDAQVKGTVFVDTIDESTTAAGVTIDGLLIKDGLITSGINTISDADNDTKIQAEESADEDIIRFDVAGTQVAFWLNSLLTFTEPFLFSTGTDVPISMLRSSAGLWQSYGDGTDTFRLYNRVGTPEGSIADDIGTRCIDTANGELYIKETDIVNTGWKRLAKSIDIEDVSSEGLLLAMDFNTDSVDGTVILDASGRNNHGVVVGAIWSATSGFNGGGAYTFNGSSDEITTGDILTNTAFTVSAWIRSDDTLTQRQAIFEKNLTASTGFMLEINAGLVGKAQLFNGFTPLTSNKVLSNNTWYHIVGTYDGLTSRLYIDGVLDTSGASTFGTFGTEVLTIGHGDFPGDSWFDGTIDEPRIYNKALTGNEIAQLYYQRTESLPSFVSQKDAKVNTDGEVEVKRDLVKPNIDIDFYEEYIGASISEVWAQNGTGATFTMYAEKNGSMRCQTAAVSGRNSFLDWGHTSGNGVFMIVPRCEMEHRRMNEETSNMIARVCALYNGDNNLICFNYTSAASANWRAQVRVGGSDTFVDTTIAADTSFHVFKIVVDTTNCTFYIDGTQRAQIATPVALESLFYQPRIGQIETTDGVSKGTRTDYVELTTYNTY